MECEIVDLLIHPELKQRFVEYAIDCPGIGSFATLADWIRDDLLEDSESVLIAVNDGKIIGFVSLLNECVCLDNDFRKPWIDFLFVNEECRNQHVGIKLLDAITRHAAGLGVNEVFLVTQLHKDYYEKQGFSITEETYDYNGGVNNVPMYVMVKTLVNH
mgnify:CR=1 FL=1|jgi:N-acetylglutamate synthase and related acetyltransferases